MAKIAQHSEDPTALIAPSRMLESFKRWELEVHDVKAELINLSLYSE